MSTTDKISCEHWFDCNVIGGGCCSINKFKKPSFEVCLHICDLGPRIPFQIVKDSDSQIKRLPVLAIDPDYVATPANATKGRCCS